MIVLGITETHCATAAILRDGVIVGCASEERFTRLKNDAGYPRLAIDALLRQCGVTAADIDLVALAGTQAMEVSAYDEALAIPTEEAATLALRTQQVIREETNITAVSDPLAGSYYVESLTDAVAAEAVKLVERIEELGGYTAAQETDWMRMSVRPVR